jgi:hypothetical protein
VPIVSALTGFFAGFVIFSTLGFMAHQKGVSVANVAVGGKYKTFITPTMFYPNWWNFNYIPIIEALVKWFALNFYCFA